MNIHNDTRTFRLEIEETSGFYFCDHFYEAFKDKGKVRNASVWTKKVQKKLFDNVDKMCWNFSISVTRYRMIFFFEARKLLIQHYPIVTATNRYIVYINIDVGE